MSYSCGVNNCGNGKCVHRLIDERCPACGSKLVEVVTTGYKFCSNNVLTCDWEKPNNRATESAG